MKRRMAVPLFFSFLLFSIAGVLWFAGVANAQVSGPCTATIAGVDANSASTPQTAVEVDKDQSIAIEVTGPDKFTGHEVKLEFAGIQWTVNEQTDDGKSWSDSVEVSKYSKYGVGLYKVIGVSTGNPCSGTAYVKVGGNPLGTAAGAAAAGMAVVGGAIVAASAARAARRPRKKLEAAQLQFSQSSEPDKMPFEKFKRVDYYLPGHEPGWDTRPEWDGRGCFGMLPTALFQTMALMVSGMGAAGAPAGTSKPKVGFAPLISVSGVIGAFMAGLGTLVLAQQFAVVYPTRTVTIVWMVASILIEVLLTTLAHRSGVKRVIAILMAAQASAPETQEPTA